jgi:hypothetical protein
VKKQLGKNSGNSPKYIRTPVSIADIFVSVSYFSVFVYTYGKNSSVNFRKNQIFPLARVGIFSNHSAASREIAGLSAIEAGVRLFNNSL